MSKIIFIFFFLYTLLEGNKNIWDFTHSFDLKKDQICKIKIVKDYKKTFQNQGILKFRWTLYHNKRLVFLLDYEGFKKQFILETRHKLNAIKVFLTDDYKRIDQRPFGIIKFVSFDASKHKAKIDLYVRDRAKRLKIKILTPLK